MQGYEFFGEIRATGTKVDCVVIPKPEEVFELYEIERVANKMREHTRHLKHVMEARFKHLAKHEELCSDRPPPIAQSKL